MRVYLYELSEEPKELHFSEKDPWVFEAVQAAQETAQQSPPHYLVDMELRKLQDVVFMKGHIKANLGLLCSRCANGFDHSISSDFEYLFTRKNDLKRPGNASHGYVTEADEEEAEAGSPEMEYLERDYIELEVVLKEQIYLKVPVQPLCRDNCKGICPVCGQDKNTEPCQCHRIKNNALANALKNIRH